MAFEAVIINGDRLAKKLDRLAKLSEDGVRQVVARASAEGEAEAKRLISRGPARSGKIRKDGTRSSAYLEPPRTDTGRLVSSINHKITEGGLNGEFGTDLKYGLYLEIGTVKMGPRPWLLPTAEKIRSRMPKLISSEIRKAAEAASKGQ